MLLEGGWKGKVEAKLHLEASWEGLVESEWRLEACLQGAVDRPSGVWVLAWRVKYHPSGAQRPATGNEDLLDSVHARMLQTWLSA